jgi:hypothetical protein
MRPHHAQDNGYPADAGRGLGVKFLHTLGVVHAEPAMPALGEHQQQAEEQSDGKREAYGECVHSENAYKGLSARRPSARAHAKPIFGCTGLLNVTSIPVTKIDMQMILVQLEFPQALFVFRAKGF